MKKSIPKFNFTNPKIIGDERVLEGLNIITNMLMRPRRLITEELINIVPFITPIILEDYPTILYTVLENEDGWYTKDTYESTLIKINLKKFEFF